MPLVPSIQTDYTDKDFDALRFRLRNLIRSVFPEWTDFNVANFGNILIELYAHVGDVLTFYQDNQAAQSRITTATQRRALLGLVKLIGFSPATATPATANVVITLPAPPAGTAIWPTGTIVKTDEVTSPIVYQLLEDAVIAAGQSPPTVTVAAENSTSQEEQFAMTGLPNQVITLSRTPFIDGSLVFIADDGAYTQVDNFLNSSAADRHFTVVVDQNDRATVRFGNGVSGAMPKGTGSSGYKTGGGAAGRVEQNKLRVFEQTSWMDSLGNTLAPTITNPQPSSGGTDRQSVAQIKERAPASIRTLNRTVAREDFEVNALRLPAVARALMLTRNEDAGIPENSGQLFIVPVGGGMPSQALKDQVMNMVTVVYPHTLTFDVGVYDPIYKDVDIFAVVYFRPGFTKSVVVSAIRANLAAFFSAQNADGTSNTQIDFGGNIKDADGNVEAELSLSDVFNVIRDTTGVRKIGATPSDFTLNGEHTDVSLTIKEFPKLGTIQLFDGDTGQAL